jgi:hypothetical protein
MGDGLSPQNKKRDYKLIPFILPVVFQLSERSSKQTFEADRETTQLD